MAVTVSVAGLTAAATTPSSPAKRGSRSSPTRIPPTSPGRIRTEPAAPRRVRPDPRPEPPGQPAARRAGAAPGHGHLRPLRQADDRPLPLPARRAVPEYVCQRDRHRARRPPPAPASAATHRPRIGELLLATVTPLALDVALAVQPSWKAAPPKPTRSAAKPSRGPATPPKRPAAATWPSIPTTVSSPPTSRPTGTNHCELWPPPKTNTNAKPPAPRLSPKPTRPGSQHWQQTFLPCGPILAPRRGNANVWSDCSSKTSPCDAKTRPSPSESASKPARPTPSRHRRTQRHRNSPHPPRVIAEIDRLLDHHSEGEAAAELNRPRRPLRHRPALQPHHDQPHPPQTRPEKPVRPATRTRPAHPRRDGPDPRCRPPHRQGPSRPWSNRIRRIQRQRPAPLPAATAVRHDPLRPLWHTNPRTRHPRPAEEILRPDLQHRRLHETTASRRLETTQTASIETSTTTTSSHRTNPGGAV